MGKSKELYMEMYDLDREYLINDMLAQEEEYLQYMMLKEDPEVHIDQTKIEVNDGNQTRIEVNQESAQSSTCTETSGLRF